MLTSLTPVVILGTMGAFVLMRWERLPLILRDAWPLLLLPGMALLSTTWSAIPGTSFYYGVLYLATVLAGMMIGRGMAPGTLLTGFFTAFAIFTVFSVLSMRFTAWGGGGTAFVGLTQSKNSAGDMAGVGLLATLCFFFSALSRRKLVQMGLALAVVPFLLFALWFSRATGALVATTAIFGVTLAWLASRLLTVQARTAIFVLAIVVIALLIATQQFWLPPLFDAVLENSGKDAGLTGRADLWIYADDLISRKPLLGLGYNGFWVHNNLDAEYIWRHMGIGSRSGFNFHNTPREILVHMGYVGLAIFAVVAIIGALRLIVLTSQTPSHERIFACAIVLFYAMKMPFEVVGIPPIHFGTLTSVAVLAMGFRRTDPARR
ncbi:O-antigen ligase family protein [Qipengyuania spongiae]|uniref:O-antigen ligase family protein n=1 Tax=Qipengyuania spongiae TaxID=2909673 RepID=A0ABY5SXN8_9SPHN|nr:O-antigen ligase family protein [Qipengyuania spongiae]UVI39085.1 O-antigen ligase family protein [Qipengyuania spongiae]